LAPLTASKTRRNKKLRMIDTIEKTAPNFRFCASVVCKPNTGNTSIWVITATP